MPSVSFGGDMLYLLMNPRRNLPRQAQADRKVVHAVSEKFREFVNENHVKIKVATVQKVGR
jgi:hypothetical protein